MVSVSDIDVRDLRSVRRAMGHEAQGHEAEAPASPRRAVRLNRSPLARKIVTFNLVAVVLMVAGMLYLAPSRDNLAYQRASGLVSEAELIADVFEARLARGDGTLDASATLDELDLRGGIEVYVFDAEGRLAAMEKAGDGRQIEGLSLDAGGTTVTNLLNGALEWAAAAVFHRPAPEIDMLGEARTLVARVGRSGTVVDTTTGPDGSALFAVATAIRQGGRDMGVVAVTSAAGEIDALVRREREQVLQMFVLGLAVSIGLSLVLASTIATPLASLAAAAEHGRDRSARQMAPQRIRIPDLTQRPDEIGHLSAALRGMVAALYDRIEGNEQFAADVSHEIKNPLASLRSAVGTMRLARREDQRERLLAVIEHDVRRLDRLVSDISNASRLDAELVKEEERTFDLVAMLRGINDHLAGEARAKDIEFISDLPGDAVAIQGLENRLAQVFVNLLGNAVSFCEEGDAIRIWARRRKNRMLIVVEDTGPGIPDEALSKIFQRFYSQRPEGEFGNNSGLGLAISKQIVEAHGGVIWAENIRPTDADPTSEPFGARFVVGLPV